jgi:hypothetical protein
VFVYSRECKLMFHRSMLSGAGAFNSEADNLLPAKYLLDFLTILWWGGCRNHLPGQALSMYLGLLVDLLSQENPDSVPCALLCDSLLTTLAVLEMTRSEWPAGINKLWEDETIWRIAMAHDRSDLPVACRLNSRMNDDID